MGHPDVRTIVKSVISNLLTIPLCTNNLRIVDGNWILVKQRAGYQELGQRWTCLIREKKL